MCAPSLVFVFFLMIRRPPRSTLDRSSAASDVYKRQVPGIGRAVPEVPVCGGGAGECLGRIRFRCSIAPEISGCAEPGDAGADQSFSRAGADAADSVGHVDFCPVSYTHLRAHETVLDLVCRLLLEKKKECTSQVQNSTLAE